MPERTGRHGLTVSRMVGAVLVTVRMPGHQRTDPVLVRVLALRHRLGNVGLRNAPHRLSGLLAVQDSDPDQARELPGGQLCRLINLR
jgi:hypothetical protein